MGDKPKRVAAYIRVSTLHDEQSSSLNTQATYLEQLIAKNPNWEFVGAYIDRGASGTTTAQRKAFNMMLKDAKNGQIDLIITKSISRFSRNTVDLLTVTRELKTLGIEVYFEEQHISSLDPKGEMLLTILVSLAQEESHNLSENIKWGIHRKMERGGFTLPYSRFLGYRKGRNGRPEVIKREAKIIQRIYWLLLNGVSINRIAAILTKKHVPTPGGGKKWHYSTVKSILTNEKYKGEALLQKTYVADYLTHKPMPNNRSIRQYYVKHSHEAIIDPQIFDEVQRKLQKNKRP